MRVKLKKVSTSGLTREEAQRLMDAEELALGKPAEFSWMMKKVFTGEYVLYRLWGGIKGLCVIHPQGDRLNIYYLNGEGLWGKMRALTQALLDIAAKGGYAGISCCTRDKVRARLFGMVPGARCVHHGKWYMLELDHHGRKKRNQSARATSSGNGTRSRRRNGLPSSEAGNAGDGREASDA